MTPEYIMMSLVLFVGLSGGWYLRREAIKLRQRNRLKAEAAKRKARLRREG